MSQHELLARKARSIGYWSFNRWAKKHGLSIEVTLSVVRSTFHK